MNKPFSTPCKHCQQSCYGPTGYCCDFCQKCAELQKIITPKKEAGNDG